VSTWLRIGGYPATEIAAHSPVTWETRADGGAFKASWAFALTRRSQHQALRPGALVEVICGGVPVFTGWLAYPDRTTWECTAYGLASVASEQFLALDGTLSNTRDVAAAIAQAQAAGWPATNPDAIAGTASGDATGNPVTLGALLDDRALDLGQRWGVDGQGRLFMAADPTSPRWLIAPEAAAFGITNESAAATLYGRYLDSTTSTYLTAAAGSGVPQKAEDLSDRGAMSHAQAVAILDGMLVERSGRAWTNGVTLTRDQIQTRGGTPAFLAGVRAGQMARVLGLEYGGAGLALDTVIGMTRYTQDEHTIYLEPANTKPRGVRALAVYKS
jgi:hypothetical protein